MTHPTPTPTSPAAAISPTLTWDGTLTALSSIAHTGENRGVTSLLRRELIVQPNGEIVPVPVISGNSWRGSLRRIGEELLRDVLDYDGLLPLPALHALRGGGALAKVSSDLSGRRLKELRELVPQIGIFGAAAGGRIIDGCLSVGKLLPHVTETVHLTGVASDTPCFSATQLETYIRTDDTITHNAPEPITTTPAGTIATAGRSIDAETGSGREEDAASSSAYLTYRIETFPAGTTFTTWLQLRRPALLEVAFFTDILTTFTRSGRIGGRRGVGHGLLRAHLTPTPAPSVELPDWRAITHDRRDDVLTVLSTLT